MSEGYHILIVDDEAAIRQTLRIALGRAYPKATIVEAYDGSDALRRMGGQLFDLLVLDIKMPRMDGYGVLKRIESLPKAYRPRAAVLLGTSEEKRLGPPEWSYLSLLEKPIAVASLIGQVKAELEPPALVRGVKPRAPVGAPRAAGPLAGVREAPLSTSELLQQAALKNGADFIEPFLQAALETLCKTGRMEAKRDRIYIRGRGDASGDFSFVQCLANESVTVSFALSFDLWTLLTYSAALFGRTYAEINLEFKAAFSALCSSIIQATALRLSERGTALQARAPEVFEGRGHSVPHAGALGHWLAIRFTTPHGNFNIETVVERKST